MGIVLQKIIYPELPDENGTKPHKSWTPQGSAFSIADVYYVNVGNQDAPEPQSTCKTYAQKRVAIFP